jgi:glycosyltransferase involved in cell wall biosynthesis
MLSHLSPQYGGIAMSVPQLARATEAQGLQECPIASFCDVEEIEQIPADQRFGVEAFSPNRMRWMVDPSLRQRLKNTIRGSSGVHIHGIWETHCMMSAWAARSCKRPYVVSVHGMLEEWALRHKRIKKALYAALVETRALHGAACLRALTTDEVDDYRRLGLTNPIAIVPNGVEVPSCVNADLFWEAYPHLVGKRIVLFLGRLHYKKGLHVLLKAWSRIAQRTDRAHLVIAGPDFDNVRASLESMVNELELRSSVTFAGMMSGKCKWAALAAASLFVLPSFSEGFSIAVLEALAMGLPSVVTVPCHIPEVAVHDCGWVVQPAVEPLQDALEQFLRLSVYEAASMGKRGRELACQRFHWSVVGKQMAEVYDWLNGGPKPSTVEIA